ncbi:uncharacterized protein LOC131036424 isoform X3 [Cryptomeria japonica]|uniref:uncharacterized protein LOC131036424 isoform X3 n=1 Tax=Cryptomeria japonica TaxID=3369 RepID=UPI0025AD9BF5|nr:uncharacterized protein LOC131036424 isoform X3 [Cryptomeria japonica]
MATLTITRFCKPGEVRIMAQNDKALLCSSFKGHQDYGCGLSRKNHSIKSRVPMPQPIHLNVAWKKNHVLKARCQSADTVTIDNATGGGTKEPKVDKDGPINLINASKSAGVKRFILVSSIGVGDSVQAIDKKTFETLKIVLEAKEVAEEALTSSGLIYTIIRPGGLLNTPPTGKGILLEDPSIAGLISRSDVASLIVPVIFDKETEMKTFSAIDSEKRFPPPTLEGTKENTDN